MLFVYYLVADSSLFNVAQSPTDQFQSTTLLENRNFHRNSSTMNDSSSCPPAGLRNGPKKGDPIVALEIDYPSTLLLISKKDAASKLKQLLHDVSFLLAIFVVDAA